MLEKVMVCSTGLTEHVIKAPGKITRLMAKASLRMSMEIFMMVTGSMTKHLGLEHISITMELNMKDNGLMISNMGMELKFG